MSIVTEYDWESDTWTHHTSEHAARAAWREAVQAITERAKATLPECHGRVDAAVKLVLAGDVALLEDGKAKVASQSNARWCTMWSMANAPARIILRHSRIGVSMCDSFILNYLRSR
jgi:hypothetical protein